jgi:hypothetical protein
VVATPAVVTLGAAPKPVSLAAAKPMVTVATTLSKATTLVLVLVNAKGKVVATWTEHAKAGAAKISLVLPAKAQKAGHDTLRITPSGKGKSKTLPVVLKA